MQAYEELKEQEKAALLRIDESKKEVERIRKILFQDKNFIINKLIQYLKKELDIQYFYITKEDINSNVVNLLIKENSSIYEREIKEKEYIPCEAELLIDKRMYNNTDEIIIVDINSDDNILNLKYLNDSLEYKFLSYSEVLKEKLNIFLEYIIRKKITKSVGEQ